MTLVACGTGVPRPTPGASRVATEAKAVCAREHPGVGPKRLATLRQSSAVALAAMQAEAKDPGERTHVIAYIADSDEPTVHTVDVTAGREIATTPLHGHPEQLLVLSDGRVAVTLRAEGGVEVLEPAVRADAPLEPRCVIDTLAEPVAMAATPDDATLVVTSAWGHALSGFDVELPREPRAVVVSDDGTRAFVSHVVGAKMSVVDLATEAHAIRAVDLRARKIEQMLSRDALGEKLRGGCQGFVLAKTTDGNKEGPLHRLFAPMVSVDPGEATRASSGYGNDNGLVATEATEVSVVDPAAERSLTRALVAVPTSAAAKPACLLPRAAAYHAGSLYVTCLGIDSLLELDARAVDPAAAETRRWDVGSGPVGVAVDDERNRAIVWSQFDRELSVVPLGHAPAPAARISLSRRAGAGPNAVIALGRRLFHKTGDPRMSRDGRACASCHPDGREDALTWSTPDGPRQTLMLAGRIPDTAPYGWMGKNAKLEDHVHQTFERLGGTGLPKPELSALLAYVRTMAPPQARAVPLPPEQKRLVDQGRALFASSEASCASCHEPDRAFLDGQKHDVDGMKKSEKAAAFDTPSLRFVGGTAPYFHDGRYASLEDLLSSSDHAMGSTMHLSRAEREALAAYLESL